jgi:NAD(P)-dependent dehydrogenase (short-subunit alcohol dehydrogenase family)
MPAPTVFITAISSDIGRRMAELYLARGCRIIGTYRTAAHLGSLRDTSGVDLIHCDVAEEESIRSAARQLAGLGRPWDIFVGAVGQLDPIGSFFDCDMTAWSRSLHVNSLAQLTLLHAVYPYRREGQTKVAFLVGGGINGTFRHYSAYCLAKVMLVKFCELIHDEYPDMHAVAIGTGWVRSKIHAQTLNAGAAAGDNFSRTQAFLQSDQTGTSVEDILACLDWCFEVRNGATAGRNFSVVHDPWRKDGVELLSSLADDPDLYRLRRRGA